MRAPWPFLIKAKPPLVEIVEHIDNDFGSFYKKDTILTVVLSDRHGLEFDRIFEEVKQSYLKSVKMHVPQIECSQGFDYYWSFERYHGRVTTLEEVFQRIGPVNEDAASAELNYLVQLNTDDDEEE